MHDQYSIRKAFFQGRITEIYLYERPPGCLYNRPSSVIKLTSGEYLITSTGEICEYKQNNSKTPDGVRRTTQKLRRLINTNFHGAPNELFITLTYVKNMTDPARLYTDFDKFIKRLRYAYSSSDFLWINAVEPQERGAFHCHVLLRDLVHDHLYIDNREITKLWGHGITDTRRLTNNSNVGAYLSAYLLNTKGKKGGRMHMYPKGMRMYRHSRNCQEPEERYINRAELRRLMDQNVITWSKEYEIKNAAGEVVNRLRKVSLVKSCRDPVER